MDQALGVLRTLSEEPLAQRCLQVVELLDPRSPYQGEGQGDEVYPWTHLLQMDLLGNPAGDFGGPAETL